MIDHNLVSDILYELFTHYQTRGVTQINLNDFISERGGDPYEYGNDMNRRGLIRLYQVTKGFSAAISVSGINQVSPNYFSTQADIVVQNANQNGGSTTVMRSLPSLPTEDWGSSAKDIAEYMKRANLADVQYERSNARIHIR